METSEHLSNKVVMVTGGTGSFGNQIVSQLVKMNLKKIIIVSRDEKKQFDMMNRFPSFQKLINFEIGDVRDYRRILELMKGVDVVYHAAALKQVPHCESNPYEAVKTNIIGAENIRMAAISSNVETVVSVSTDKAVKPVNAMGMTKALQEKILLQEGNDAFETRFVCVRYGNVLGSRGSVVPFFRDLIKMGKPIPITHQEMTRFLLTLPEAITLVFKATTDSKTGELWVRKMPACKITDLAEILGRRVGGRRDYPIFIAGVRPGEKIHEVLVSEEEMRRSTELDEYFLIHPHRSAGDARPNDSMNEYTSQNTKQMTKNELEDMLGKNNWLSPDEPPHIVE